LLPIFKKKSQYALKLERILGFYPKKIAIYQQALTHKSHVSDKNKVIKSNERLEFLGDSVLNSVISHYLFSKYPFIDEGQLTQLRSRFVSRETLNTVALKIGLGELIEKKQEDKSVSILGNALEAIIGAIYVDKGYDETKKFVYKQLIGVHIDSDKIVANETNFKSRVIEWCQKNKIDFEFITDESEKNQRSFFSVTLLVGGNEKGKGEAFSKKKAEQHAAQQFYEAIKEEL